MNTQSVIDLGFPAPDFTLPDLNGDLHTLKDLSGRIVIINFWSAECPWSQRIDREMNKYLQNWGNSVVYLAIASNANEGLDLITSEASERGLPLVLHDVDHQVADLYGAITTPHLFVIDTQGILRYQGAFDDVNFRQRTPNQYYLLMAVEALLQGDLPKPSRTLSYGCTIVRDLY